MDTSSPLRRRLQRTIFRRGLPIAVALALVAGPLAASPPPALAVATDVAPPPVTTSFETEEGLSPGFPVSRDENGAPAAKGVVSGAPESPGLSLAIDDGPDRAYASKADVGFTGLRALHYAGTHTVEGEGNASNVVMDVDVDVAKDTRLSYLVFPDFDEQAIDYAGSYVAIDLVFTDGTRLSATDLRDQKGVRMTPRDQGEARTIHPLQWNRVSAAVGEVSAGKTIDRVEFSYDGPTGPATIGGWLDDVSIGAEERPERETPADWVVTTRGTQSNGTYSRGNNFPAAAMPNGFNFWTPMTDASSKSEFYAYNEDNNEDNLPEIQAFAASHQPSIWMGDRQTFQVMPSLAEGVPDPDRAARAMAFQHEDETDSPHQYGVTFQNGLRADVAPTDHAALFDFDFPDGGGRHVIFDNVDDNAGLTIDTESGTVSGWSDTRVISTGMTRMFMYAEFDSPMTGSGMLVEGNRPSTGYVSFDSNEVTMRIATSLISVDQARANLSQEIAADDTLADVVKRAKSAWNERLEVIEVEGGSDDQLTTLYSNLYRLNLYPNSAYENTGTVDDPRYQHAVQSSGSWSPPASTPTETGARIADGKVFVNTGFWDTFRAAWPAYSLLAPETAGELVDGFVQQYRDGGWISPWSSPGYARVMTGTSSDSAFADAFSKNVPGIDPVDTYDAALKNATVRPPDDSIGRQDLARSPFVGYASNDIPSGFAWSIDGAMNDFAIAKMAQQIADDPDTNAADRKRLGEEAEYLLSRSEGYAELYDPEIGFFQGLSADGTPTSPPSTYDPESWGNDHDYTEANGWNVAFPAPYDGQGLAELYGGREGLADKLDEFFSTPETALKPGSYGGPIHEMQETRDLGLGQWSIPNQVSHHIPWMYNYTQQPYKAQREVRAALDRGWIGSDIGQGYPGDEDNGATSAWWIFGALGMYPLQSATGEYTIGSPLFDKATLHLPGGDVVIEAPQGDGDVYVQGLSVDGKKHTSTALAHSEFADGAKLEFTMGPEPSTWGTGADDVPTSVTAVGDTPAPMRDVTGAGRGAATSAGGEDVDALFDDTSLTAATLSGFAPSLQYSVSGGDEAEVEFYTFTSGSQGTSADPSRWVLEGSDDGTRWQVLDRRQGEQFTWRGQTRPFELQRPASMREYRVKFLGARGSAGVSLAEVEFLTRDALAESPLAVEMGDASLRAGGTAEIPVTVTNVSDETVSPTLTLTAPEGWSVEPETMSLADLAPGGAATVPATVVVAADAAPGSRSVTATAVWDGWSVTANGGVQVVGDVTVLKPGTPDEAGWLVADDGSSLTGADGGQARYADSQASFVYRLPLPADVTAGTVTVDIANHFLVEVSPDRENWTEVLREEGTPIFQSNRAERQLDVAALRAAVGSDGSAVYLRFSDSHPEDGWGAWLAGIRLETSG